MNHSELKTLRSKLKFGDAKQISDECGTSTTTFQKAVRGEIDTPIAKVIIAYTKKLIKDREDRLDYLRKKIKPLYIRVDEE